MRGSLLALLGCAAAVSAVPGVNLPGPGAFVTRSFPLLSPEAAASQVSAAEATNPAAVSRPSSRQTDGPLPPQAKPMIHSDIVNGNNALPQCSNPAIHYEWNNLTPAHRQEYSNAVLCLLKKPSNGRFPGSRSRWEDMVVVHQQMADIIHNVGQFLPWHRYYMWIFEQLMRRECGYGGPMTWWDETKNAGNFNGAAPFTSQYLGHMPVGNVVCIISGVIANTVCHIGPGGGDTTHCLSRGVNEQLSASVTTNFVNTCNSYTAYNDMQQCSFYGPHAYAHDAIGGVMSDVATSPGDPAFFLHHSFIDRNWRIWQRTNPGPRTYAIGGFTTQGGNTPTTLSYVLSSMGLMQDVTVNDVMDTQGTFLCYHYDY